MSNSPTVLFGLVPLVRAVVRSATNATTTTITPDDSGTLFVSMSTSAHNYALPAVADGAGKCFMFFQAGTTAQAVTITSTANNIIGGDTTADVATSGSVIGDCCMIIGDGTYYYLFAFTAWTVA